MEDKDIGTIESRRKLKAEKEAIFQKWCGIIDRHPQQYYGLNSDCALIPKDLLPRLAEKFEGIREYVEGRKETTEKETPAENKARLDKMEGGLKDKPVDNLEGETKPKKNSDFIETSKIIDDKKKIIVEQIYDEENGNRFCIYNHKTGKIKYAKSYTMNDVKYAPIIADEIKKGAVLLPSEALDYFEDEILDNEIMGFAKKWLDVPDEIFRFGLWNTKVSWVFENFQTINYLRVQGDTGTGKTRYLDVWGQLHYKPIFTTGSTSSAPLFRIIDKWKGTIVMDEADLKQSDESADIIKVLNNGFERGKFIMRCDQNDASKISFFDPFCPKILATRRSFTDKATESRCITHITSVTTDKDIPVNINDKFREEALELRNKLLMWRFKNYFEIEERMKENLKIDLGDIEPRVKQIVQSFVYLFSGDVKGMAGFKEYLKTYQEELVGERQGSFDGLIVESILGLLKKGRFEFTTMDIIRQGDLKTFDGKTQMSARSLTPRLKSLGFKKGVLRKIDGTARRIIPINKEHVEGVFKRYGFDVDFEIKTSYQGNL